MNVDVEVIKAIFDDKNKKKILEIVANNEVITTKQLIEKMKMKRDQVKKILNYLLNKELIKSVSAESDDTNKYSVLEAGSEVLEYTKKDWNPSRSDTNRGKVFEILSDCEWHCADCELPGSQVAKDIQQIRIEGFEFEGSPSFWGENRHCENCERKTVHRRMKYPFPTDESVTRGDMPESFKTRVRKLYDHRDAFDGSSPSTTIEVDHRIPEVRWKESEDFDFENMDDDEIREHFQVLSRKNNLMKSRKCEKCDKTGKRPSFFGIEFYYEGDEEYDQEVGCEGCGWAYTQKWKDKLNEKIKKNGW